MPELTKPLMYGKPHCVDVRRLEGNGFPTVTPIRSSNPYVWHADIIMLGNNGHEDVELKVIEVAGKSVRCYIHPDPTAVPFNYTDPEIKRQLRPK